jgi:hypothetical protein
MDLISLALIAINGLRTVMANPALGGGSSVRLGQASELLGILGTLIAEGDDALDDLKEFTQTIEEMAKQGREPTPEEWDIMRRRSDDAHERLQRAKEELLAEDEPEELELVEPEEPEVPDPDPSPAADPEDPPEEEDPPITG